MEVSASVTGVDQAVQDFLATERILLQKLMRQSDIEMTRVQSLIQSTKLEGQVLHHRSGKGIASIRMIPAQLQGSIITGGVQGGGGVAWYMALHESGGTFNMPERNRRIGFNSDHEQIRLLTHGGRVRKAVKSISTHRVRKGSITFPERSFMRSTWEEERAGIEARMQGVVLNSGTP